MSDPREAALPAGEGSILDKPLPKGTPDDYHTQAQCLPCKQQTQPFFELPAEIRNLIYELAMPSKERGDSLIITTPNWDGLMVSAEQPAITRTSKQARSEALPMFYGTNELISSNHDFRTLVKWADCVTSVPKAPKLRVEVFMLDKMSCNVGLKGLALAWRDIKHETIHLTIASRFPGQAPGKAQCKVVADVIKFAEERKVAGDQRDETTVRHLLISGILGGEDGRLREIAFTTPVKWSLRRTAALESRELLETGMIAAYRVPPRDVQSRGRHGRRHS